MNVVGWMAAGVFVVALYVGWTSWKARLDRRLYERQKQRARTRIREDDPLQRIVRTAAGLHEGEHDELGLEELTEGLEQPESLHEVSRLLSSLEDDRG